MEKKIIKKINTLQVADTDLHFVPDTAADTDSVSDNNSADMDSGCCFLCNYYSSSYLYIHKNHEMKYSVVLHMDSEQPYPGTPHMDSGKPYPAVPHMDSEQAALNMYLRLYC